MAAHVFNILPEHDKGRIHLHGDMSVSFDQAVDSSFSVRFFTTTNEWFSFDTTKFRFKDTSGADVSGLMVGGKPGVFIELMFDAAKLTWYITANNMINGTGAGTGTGVDTSEKILTFLPLPSLTSINYASGRNWRGTLSGDAKLKNPTGMHPGDNLKVVIQQDTIGSRKLTFDGAYGFKDAQIPTVSTVPQAIDILDCYMTSDGTLQCDLRLNYSVVMPIAYGTDFGYTMQQAINDAQTNPITGQTVQVIRDGYRSECNGTVGFNLSGFDLRIKGIPNQKGILPTLKLEHTDRPAFGKALVNIEGGRNVVVEDLKIQGTSTGTAGDGNGTGVLINGGPDYVLINRCHLFDNEDGVRSGVSSHPVYDLVDTFLDTNGRADNPSHIGYSHSIYAGECTLWRATRTTFYNSVGGHNIKTRSLATVLKQVYSHKSNYGREIDCCDQGIMHVYDSVFWKYSDAIHNNLISIGAECLNGVNRVQEYFFYNCYFHHDVDPQRDVQYLENVTRGVNNTVAVHFIDCLWGGLVLNKTQYRDNLFKGPYTITRTGGPLGPRVPVGASKMIWNPSTIDPKASANPLNITETPLASLPAMTVLADTPPYPTFLPMPTVPPLPSPTIDGPPPTPDTTPPTVSLTADSTSISVNGSVTLTAIASDNVGVAKVEFYRDGTLLFTATGRPYTITETYTYLDNGNYTYNVIAYDSSQNQTTSSVVTVSVNIPPPHTKPTMTLSLELQAGYDSAAANAAMGSKRAAAANYLITQFGSVQKLSVYRDGTVILAYGFSKPMELVDDGYDVYIQPTSDPTGVSSYDVFTNAPLSTGNWWYELSYDQVAPARVIAGSVGGVGSGADVILEQDPSPTISYNMDFKFILPRTLDNLA